MQRLPKEACIHTSTEQRMTERWTVTDHLLAMLVEVSSIPASGRSLKKPIEIPRPKDVDKPQVQGRDERDVAFKKGIATLASTARGVH